MKCVSGRVGAKWQTANAAVKRHRVKARLVRSLFDYEVLFLTLLEVAANKENPTFRGKFVRPVLQRRVTLSQPQRSLQTGNWGVLD